MTLLLSLALAAIPVTGGEIPQWQVGDKWALGVEKDFSSDFDKEFAKMKKNMTEEDDIKSVDYTTSGKAGYFASYEIVDSGDENLIKLVSSRGVYVHLAASLTVVGDHFQVGNHTDVGETCTGEGEDKDCDYDLPREEITMTVKGGADFVVKLDTTALFTKDNLDLKELVSEFSIGAEAALGVENMPEDNEGNSTWDNGTVTYDWVDIKRNTGKLSGSASFNIATELVFEPALKVFDFPLEPNKEWNSTVNVTPKISFWGDIDLAKPQGLDQADIDEMLEGADEAFGEMNWTKRVRSWNDLFPLRFPSNWMNFDENIPEEANLKIIDNKFVLEIDTISNVTVPFHTGAAVEFTLPDGTKTQAVPILPGELDDEGRAGNESESEDFMGGAFDNIQSYFDDSGQTVGAIVDLGDSLVDEGTVLESVPISFDEATQMLEDKADPEKPREGGVNAAGYVTDDQPIGAIDDADDKSPLPGPGLVVGVLAIAAMAVLYRRREA